MLKAASLVDFEHEGTDFMKLTLFLIYDSDHVHCFGSHVIECTKINILKTHVDEVSKFFSILQITVVNKLHQ